ncbi:MULTISPECIES: hypothetical protein [Vibrio]|uniref:hypothetical protein n=1 Tax=Vibrio TaxID=662 RepID=UPI001120D516|nr:MULTISPECIES: hypothetical protein [Vibrio]MBT0096406.1 hypothetical protein [Vibrio alginolyticus]MDW1906916.1 hypothetical protein [Vibrio sp. 705]MDW2189054.1 hypothetical protein [Vibrio sp. 1733]MDW2238979.1 hypothetical protein [Vibrio sp. 1565-1]TOP47782.1 hypothetical protein CGH14_21755 [Vibrio parahaemolyticus]
MVKKIIIAAIIGYSAWVLLVNDSLKTYNGCVDAMYSQFTAITDRTERQAMARLRCDELVLEGKVSPN